MKNNMIKTRHFVAEKVITCILFCLFSVTLFAQNFQNEDTLNIHRLPVTALDSQFFKFIPSVDYTGFIDNPGQTRFTTDFEPGNSTWCSQCEEEDVYLGRMSHFLNEDTLWDLRIGKGGQIYSFTGPYGEGVPPSIHPWSDFEKSRWNDEVWQIVSVNTNLNNSDRFTSPPGTSRNSTIPSMKYFIHGAGIYLNDPDFDEVFYSPLMASWYDPDEKAYYVTNWGQHPHIPSIHKSGLLVTTKYKDIGAGILEVTYILQNAGTDLLNYHNLPWGGVRKSNLPQAYLSRPDNSLDLRTERFGGDNPGILSSIDESGGYFMWTEEGNNDDRGALSIVFGKDTNYDELKDKANMKRTRLRWGDASGDTERSYQVFVLNPILDIHPGETFFYRLYYINGTKEYVHEISQQMVPFCDYGFIDVSPETSPVTRIKTTDLNNAFTRDITLFTAPVQKMIPLYLMKNTETGQKYISPDLYYNVTKEPFSNPYNPGDEKYETYQNREVNKPYDGKINYLRLLGYGVQKDQVKANVRFALLDSLVANEKLVIIPPRFKNKIWIPVELCEDCAQEILPDPVSGFVRYNGFDSYQKVKWAEPFTMEFSDNIDNPSEDNGNPSSKVGKIVRGEGTWSHIHFEMEDYLDLSENYTFRVKAYYESNNPVPDNCEIFLILRDGGPNPAQQYGLREKVTQANQWITYEFVCPGAHERGPYNQVWLFFSSPDYTWETTGQVFYIDDLTGPPLSIRGFDIHTPLTGDSIIISFDSGNTNLISVSNPVFKIKDADTKEEINYSGITWNEKHIYLHIPDSEPITDKNELTISFISGDVIDNENNTLPKFKDIPILNNSGVIGKIRLLITAVDTKTEDALSGVSIVFEEDTFTTDNQGQLELEIMPGKYSVSAMKNFYESYRDTLSLSGDTTMVLQMARQQAEVTFIILDDSKTPLSDGSIQLNRLSMDTDNSGQAQFGELDLGKTYNYDISKMKYASVSGSFQLLQDTIIEHTLYPDYTGIQLNKNRMPIIAFWNPTTRELTIKSETTLQKISIYNIRGQLITTHEAGESRLSLNTEQFVNGWYILRGDTGKEPPLRTVFYIFR